MSGKTASATASAMSGTLIMKSVIDLVGTVGLVPSPDVTVAIGGIPEVRGT
jgi:hypothetical protein